MKRWVTFALAAGLAGEVASQAFVVDLQPGGRYRRWNVVTVDPRVSTNLVNLQTRAIRYYVASDAYSAANHDAELNAIRASFDQWQAIPGTAVKFEEAGFIPPASIINSADDTNTVSWAKNSTFINGENDDISGLIAVTYFTIWSDSNTMAEADIILNGVEFLWTTTPTSSSRSYFIESIVLHEIGHLLGLDHSPVGGATMLGISEGGTGVAAGLTSDEIAAARFLYPQSNLLSTLGRLQGVVSLNGAGILGAVVMAQDMAGNVVEGTVSRADGSYELPALGPGSYGVWVSPLSPPTGSPLLSGINISSDFRAAQTAFLPSAPVPVSVSAGTSSPLNFPVVGSNPAFRITWLREPTAIPGAVMKAPFAVQPGQGNFVAGVYGPNLPVAGTSFTVTGDGISLGDTVYALNSPAGLNFIGATIHVASNATPGLRTLIVQHGSDLAYANGFMEILEPIPDHNFDGLDDRFQRRYFPRWTAPIAGPNADPDGDGMNNLAEYIAGTNPTDPASVLRFSRVTNLSGRPNIEWLSVPGKTYQLFNAAQITGATWQPVGPAITAATATASWLDPSPGDIPRFYRVQVLP